MAVSEGTATVNGKTVKARLHIHEFPEPGRSEYRGGPEGHGYIEGPMPDIQHLADNKPASLVINGENGVPLEILEEVQWKEAEVMWDQGEYVHGIVHVEWK